MQQTGPCRHVYAELAFENCRDLNIFRDSFHNFNFPAAQEKSGETSFCLAIKSVNFSRVCVIIQLFVLLFACVCRARGDKRFHLWGPRTLCFWLTGKHVSWLRHIQSTPLYLSRLTSQWNTTTPCNNNNVNNNKKNNDNTPFCQKPHTKFKGSYNDLQKVLNHLYKNGLMRHLLSSSAEISAGIKPDAVLLLMWKRTAPPSGQYIKVQNAGCFRISSCNQY